MTKDAHEGFGSSESREEYISSIHHRLLHQSWIQFDILHGKSIDDLLEDSNPTQYIRRLKEVGSTLKVDLPLTVNVVNSKRQPTYSCYFSRIHQSLFTYITQPKFLLHACVAVLNGFHFQSQSCSNSTVCKPFTVNPSTDYQTVFDSSKLFGYVAQQAEVPVIIDTGASISLTPIITDFVGEIHPAELDSLQGLSTKKKCVVKVKCSGRYRICLEW